MANISQTKKMAWTTPVLRKLSGAEAEEARNLLFRQLEPSKKTSSVRSR